MADKKQPAQTQPSPTMDDVQAIGNAAGAAAEETTNQGGSPDAAGEAAASAAAAEASSRGIELPQSVIDQIAKASATATIAELASQRAIVAPEPEPTAAEPEPDQGAGGDQAPPIETDDAPPRRTTLAEKLLAPYRR